MVGRTKEMERHWGNDWRWFGTTNFWINYGCILKLGSSFVFIAIVVTVWIIIKNKFSAESVLAISICSGLFITPYSWMYDHAILIVPILYLVVEMTKKKIPLVLPSLTFMFFGLIYSFLLVISIQMIQDVWNGLVPLVIFVLIVIFQKRLLQKQIRQPDLSL
jgi:hypothetical protein